MFDKVIFESGQSCVTLVTAIVGADIGLDFYMLLLVGFPLAAGLEGQSADSAFVGSLLGVSYDVRF